MTVRWPEIQDAIRTFVERTGVVGPNHVVWDREAPGVIFHESSVELRISTERAVGDDDVAYAEVSPGIESVRITGNREFTLTMRFRARTPADAYNARAALETIRASFHHPARRRVLTDRGIAFLSTEMLDAREVTFGDRFETIASLDVRLGVVSELVATAEPDLLETVDAVSFTEGSGTAGPRGPYEVIDGSHRRVVA